MKEGLMNKFLMFLFLLYTALFNQGLQANSSVQNEVNKKPRLVLVGYMTDNSPESFDET